jgi:hypothetical protein
MNAIRWVRRVVFTVGVATVVTAGVLGAATAWARGGHGSAHDGYAQFRDAMAPGAFTEVTWEHVADLNTPLAADSGAFASLDFTMSTAGNAFTGADHFMVSHISFGYESEFSPYSGANVMSALGNTVTTLTFREGTGVSSFGAVFLDVEKMHTSALRAYDVHGQLLGTASAQPGPHLDTRPHGGSNAGYSFASIATSGALISKVEIIAGTCAVNGVWWFLDCNRVIENGAYKYDGVVMDNFIYAKPTSLTAVTAVPEPGLPAMLLAGAVMLGAVARRRLPGAK